MIPLDLFSWPVFACNSDSPSKVRIAYTRLYIYIFDFSSVDISVLVLMPLHGGSYSVGESVKSAQPLWKSTGAEREEGECLK